MRQIPEEIDHPETYKVDITSEEMRILDYVRKEKLRFPKDSYWKEYLRMCFIVCGKYPLFCKWVAESLRDSGFVTTNYISQTVVLQSIAATFVQKEPTEKDMRQAMRLCYSLRGMAETAVLLESAIYFDNALLWGVPDLHHALNIRYTLGLTETRCPIIMCGEDSGAAISTNYIHQIHSRGELFHVTERLKADYEKARMKYVIPEVFRKRRK